MHECTSGSLLVVNAGVDSMGGVTDGGVEISSAPSLQKSSDLEKTQAELRETFSAAERFRRELEFLQKGGDPLDLTGNAASLSLQSTSLTGQDPEQFVTSEVKGSFAITASPHGDSVESSGRLGGPSVGEPNSADNLMLFDDENKFHPRTKNTTPSEHYSKLDVGRHAKDSGESVALELPKKSYKRRVRSRPNRDGGRSTFRDTKGLLNDADNQEKFLLNSSKPKSLDVTLGLKDLASNSRLDIKQNDPGSVGRVEQETLSGSEHPFAVDMQTVGNSGEPLLTKGLDSKSSCSQTKHSSEGNTENELPGNLQKVDSSGPMELSLAFKEAPSTEGNNLNTVNDDKILNIGNDSSISCPSSHTNNGSTLKEDEGLIGSESALQQESKKPALSTGCTSFREPTLSQNACSQNDLKLATKEHEDSILEEARIIEDKRKRIARLPVGIFLSESRHRSHWHFVLEEMTWLANDFAQERLWKATAAAQISRTAAFSSRVRLQLQKSLRKHKEIARTLADAVMEFWHTLQIKCQGLELEAPKKDSMCGLRQYGMRFMEYNSSNAQYSSTQAPMTPDRISDLGSIDISWEDNLTEENLFYTVPPGAVEAYRKSIESHLLQCERTDSSMQEEVDASGYDAVADDMLEENEGETSTYYLPGAFEGGRSSVTVQKKRKLVKAYDARSYEMADVPVAQSFERDIGGIQTSVLIGKRPASSINVSIPTKRVRTATRPRFTGTSGVIQAQNRADASSGDTNSFHDDHSSLHGPSQMPYNMEAESVRDYEKQLPFDSTEVSNRPRKKKKTKHPGSTFEHQWQLDSNFQNDQKDHSKRRLDTRQFDSNGNSVASQMSNMSNPNKFMKLLARDRGRKAKSHKTPSGQQGSGSPWTLFEDQALVVLVHDLGANWELISDAINSTLQLKCISRNSKECKERHNILMDRNTGDGADSAEDSGSSQPYPSTLPGIPEGSARQLFQRLQGPMEEESLKTHFENIIMIWQKQRYRRKQKDNQDPKQLQQPHGSHALALSQVFPNNLNGGPVLTPLDLYDANSTGPDFVPVGYQAPHTAGGLPIGNQGTVAPMVPGSTSGSSLPGSSPMAVGSHLASASAPHSPSVRDGRYGIPRAGPLSIDEQQRMQQYNQMSARNMQQSSLPPGSHSGTDRGVRVLPGGNGMGGINGMNRNMAMARPGFQGLPSPSTVNSGVAMPTPANMHAGAGPGQGNAMRPREALRMMRPNQNTDHQRQAMAPDRHLQQVSQGGSAQGVPPFTSAMVSFPNPMSPQQSPHMPNSNSRPHHLQGPPNLAANSQHPALGMRFMKERQLHQQRLLQQQFAASNAIMPHGQPQQSPLPVSSPQSSTQIQSQSSSPVSLSPIGTSSLNPMPQHPQKQPVPPPQGLVRNPQTGGNHTMKPQRRQLQVQPPGKQHSQQQAKVIKGNGFSDGHSVAEKGEQQVGHQMLQSGQGNLNPGPSGLSPATQAASKQPMSRSLNQSLQKRFPGQQKRPSLSDTTINNHAPSVVPSSGTPPVMAASNHRQPQPRLKLASQTQTAAAQRAVQNLKANSSDLPTGKLQAREVAQISEPYFDSCGLVLDNATQFGKVPTGMSPPRSNSEDTDSEHSESAVNYGVVRKQSSPDTLPNSLGRDAGVQWQQQPSS
ncbi:HAS subgroup [Artemisia annua]|uniref:HAS subgroup n=1 Tax=Artemisia annua TaxID=35608 RepID=A0A2U1MPC9_ARTAN|nr:HAS subgroup [Artemisia annua]